MKIVHVVPSLVKGGAERVLVDLANHSSAQGHEVTVIAAKKVDETLLRNDLRPEIAVRYITEATDGLWKSYLDIVRWILEHRDWLFGQDVLHCHLTFGSVFGSAVQMLRKLLRRNKPAVIESYQAVGAPISKFKRRVHGWLGRQRDAFVVMADDGYWGDWLKRHPKLFSRIIPNGIAQPAWGEVSPEERERYRREIGVPEGTRWVISTVGRVVAERRPAMYLPILRKVIDTSGPDVHFIYAGGGPYEEELRAEIARHGLEGKVSITGLVRNPALPLSITDVYITYNIGAVAGIATLEAVFKRLPVVAVQVYEGYDGRSDWIKSGTDTDELAADVVELLQSPEARVERAARQHAYAWDNLRVEVMARSYNEVYARARAA